QILSEPLTCFMAIGSGESEMEPSGRYTTDSHPPAPTEAVKVKTQTEMSVKRVSINPFDIVCFGSIASSARFATPSMPRKNQIAKGTAAKMPSIPFGREFIVRLDRKST